MPPKKKGRAPAHQNKFAFRHNPKSKQTEKILAAPIECVCRRCKDKLEWRKKYRKYKPRTVPGRCNLCHEKRVLAAYHTICSKCTASDKAWTFMKDAQKESQSGNQATTVQQEQQDEQDDDHDPKPADNEENEDGEENPGITIVAQLLASAKQPERVCAMCVKEPALKDASDQDTNVSELVAKLGPMSLREKKSIERQLVKEIADADGGEHDVENDEIGGEEDEEEKSEEKQSDDDEEEKDLQSSSDHDGYREEDDPFLKAVGGADKLLTGEAYQQMLLAKHAASSTGTS